MTDTNNPFSPLNEQEKASSAGNIKSSADEGIAIAPVPDNVQLDLPPHSLGNPVHHWIYLNAAGQVLFYVFRFVLPNGGKEDRPLTYREFKNGKQRWHWKSVDAPRPLYGLDRLAARPDAPVIVCEGEKAADAATLLFPDHVAVTSPNGAGSPHKADWAPLEKREVKFWPDNDDNGRKYSRMGSQYALEAGAASASIVQIPEIFPAKWDLADELPEGFTKEDLQRLLNEAGQVFNPLDGLLERATVDPGECFKPEVLEALSDLQRQDRAAYETLRSKIKKLTNVRVGSLDQAIGEKRAENGESANLDHLVLAREVIDYIGKENLLSTVAHVWRWNTTGVWKTVADRGIKQDVQNILEAGGQVISRSLVDAVSDVLKSEIYAPEHAWNINQDTINVVNGELHWGGVKFELRPHRRDHYQTTQIPVFFDPLAKCPRFVQFLNEIFEGDLDMQEKSKLVLEMIGYTLASHARFERFILLIGPGANGKSVIMEIVRALVGKENVAAVQPTQFNNKFQRAHLHSKLANLVTEIAEGGEIADAELKAIVSGELTTAEHKNKDPFDFTPFCTCWFGANHLPHTRDFSDALFRRAMVVPFNRTFKAGIDADPDLKTKLIAELPGIMNLALEAFAEVLKRGTFTEPKSCLAAKQEWRLEADQVAQFVGEECVMDAVAFILSRDLYDRYQSWAIDAGITRKLNRKNFTNRLIRLGCKIDRRGAGGQRVITGVRLLPPHDSRMT